MADNSFYETSKHPFRGWGKLDILAIGVHPDDVELGCSGTLINEIKRGKKIGIVDLTQGELGTRGTIETRYDEAANAREDHWRRHKREPENERWLF
ncbi:MAG: PIG-L family deacetylase [Chitinophagaceae bacterium]